MSVIYPRMAVIGCGLIGSSVIRAAREAGAVGHVFVADASEAHRARIAELGYESAGDLLQATLDVIASCTCATGCPSCVQSPKCGNGNDPLDKDGATRLLRHVMMAV